MRWLISLIAVWLTISAACAGPMEDGIDALDRGDGRAAFAAFEQAAKAGRPEAMIELGRLLLDGAGVPKDPRAAADWFRKAALKGSSEGQYLLGVLTYDGLDGESDPSTAATWFAKAAAGGNAEAAYNLAVFYEEGTGVPRNMNKAIELYRQSANGGVLEAEHTLGSILAFGRGVQVEKVEGTMWLEVAASAGDGDVVDELSAIRATLSDIEKAAVRKRMDEHQQRSPHH